MKSVFNFLCLSFFVALSSCNTNRTSRVTAVFYSNQNPGYKQTIDTLMKDQIINTSDTVVDIFFTKRNFHFPYHTPTNGIFKDGAKERECDIKNLLQRTCYEYDRLNRVIRMAVQTSGSLADYYYTYDDNNRIVTANNMGHDIYVLTYNSDNNLTEIKETNLMLEKKLVFIYK